MLVVDCQRSSSVAGRKRQEVEVTKLKQGVGTLRETLL